MKKAESALSYPRRKAQQRRLGKGSRSIYKSASVSGRKLLSLVFIAQCSMVEQIKADLRLIFLDISNIAGGYIRHTRDYLLYVGIV